MYEYYDGDRDPLLHEREVQTAEDIDMWDAVECGPCGRFWAGQLLEENQCPECGGECSAVEPDEE